MIPVRILLRLLRPFAWVLPAFVVLGLLASLAEGVGIGMMIPVISLFVQDSPATESGVVGWLQQIGGDLDKTTRLLFISGIILLLVVLKSVVVGGFYALSAWVNGRVSHHLRGALFGQMMEVGYAFIVASDVGRLANTLETESRHTSKALEACASLIINACAVVAFVVLLLLMSWPLTLVILGGAAGLSVAMRFAMRYAQHIGQKRVQADAWMSERIWEALGAMRLIRIFGQEEREQQRFDRASERIRQALFRMQLVVGLMRPMLEALYVPIFLASILFAWYTDIGIATLLTFLMLAYRLQPYIRGLDEARVQLAALTPAVADVAAMIDRSDKPYVWSGARPFDGLRESIVFDRVGFRYGGHAERPALHEVSARIGVGAVTAIVGPSGAGKSTLINLLCRLYDPNTGEIRVDGVPLHELDLVDWRRHLAVAGQDLDLIAGTVRDNIAYGRPDADDPAIARAARLADAHAFIEALPNGYATRVGDRGVRLSGGQRQRIGLARALLRDPDVLILDEATNAVDSLSEAEIQVVLNRLAGRSTIVIIAHRMSTIRNASQVIVLEDGRVVEAGRPSELVHTQGSFAGLYAEQQAAGGLRLDSAGGLARSPARAAPGHDAS